MMKSENPVGKVALVYNKTHTLQVYMDDRDRIYV